LVLRLALEGQLQRPAKSVKTRHIRVNQLWWAVGTEHCVLVCFNCTVLSLDC
jgi:hypothetical protein